MRTLRRRYRVCVRRVTELTLIVAKAGKENLYMLGDTKLTLRHEQQSNPFLEGCLKQYILTDEVAIGFAGNMEDFEQALSDLLACSSGENAAEVAKRSQAGGKDFDLLVAEVGCDHIKVVRNGSIFKRQTAFVGSQEGFNAFQRAYHDRLDASLLMPEGNRAAFSILRVPEPAEDDTYGRMFNARKHVIWDESIRSVGGSVIPLCSHEYRFEYMNYADVTSDPFELPEGETIIEFGTAESGGYTTEFTDDKADSGDGRTVGTYFLQGGFGILYLQNDSSLRVPVLIRAENPAFWELETYKKTGHALSCGILNEEHCRVAGEKLLRAQQEIDAIYCYERGLERPTLRNAPAYFDRYLSGYATAVFNSGRRDEAIAMLSEHIAENSTSPGCTDMLCKMLATYSIR